MKFLEGQQWAVRRQVHLCAPFVNETTRDLVYPSAPRPGAAPDKGGGWGGGREEAAEWNGVLAGVGHARARAPFAHSLYMAGRARARPIIGRAAIRRSLQLDRCQ